MAGSFVRAALTGGIGTGKSYCLAKFAELGAPTIDADAVARQAVTPGTSGFEQVVSRFGTTILRSDGSLNREALAALVFADTDARRALEAIIHPVVYRAIERWFEGLARGNHATVGIADIPLLFETGRSGEFDAVIVTNCPPEMQRSRVLLRSGLSAVEVDRRIAAQLPLADKVRAASYVIDTSGTFEDTDRQVRQTWERLNRGESRQP